MKRCAWVPTNNPLYEAYHDTEWGVPVHDDQTLFEFIVLESSQAGLSWETILKKREGYRKHFYNFDPERVARMGAKDIEKALADPGIVRHRGKVEATIGNAQAFLQIQKEFGSFCAYLWGWVEGEPLVNRWKQLDDIPAVTPLAKAIATDMKKRGFKFFGPTICYAYLQAVGVVNDHMEECWRDES